MALTLHLRSVSGLNGLEQAFFKHHFSHLLNGTSCAINLIVTKNEMR